MPQTLPIRENYLVIFIHIILRELYFEICPEMCPALKIKNQNLKVVIEWGMVIHRAILGRRDRVQILNHGGCWIRRYCFRQILLYVIFLMQFQSLHNSKTLLKWRKRRVWDFVQPKSNHPTKNHSCMVFGVDTHSCFLYFETLYVNIRIPYFTSWFSMKKIIF